MRFGKKKQIQPLAYFWYVIPVTIIALTGLFDSLYLSISHYRNYLDIGYRSFCAISKAINCDTVAQSPYSIFLDVPVAVWGLFSYGFFLFLLSFAWLKAGGRKRMWTMLMLISFAFNIFSAVLAFFSVYYIHSYCIMCILSYGVNLALLFYAWIIRKRFACESLFTALKQDILFLFRFSKVTFPVLTFFAASVVWMILAFPPYWRMSPPVLSKNISTGVENGHPWIGAEHPELIITEFSDYQCFQCKKMHYYLRRLIEAHSDKIRLIHRHFPMDHTINPLVKEPFHVGSSKMALLAIFATQKDRFWEMNDYLFNIPKDFKVLNIQEVAEKTGLDFKDMRHVFYDQGLWDILWNDIKDGIATYKLTGTPAFIINGQTYSGQIPADILKAYL
jgi:uncharacterized membrane protein/protein-disulfide isomerase